jgi:hypothetical protein
MERIAWRSAMQSERGVVCEKGAVAKKAVFSLTNIVNRKRAFNIDKTCAYRFAISQSPRVLSAHTLRKKEQQREGSFAESTRLSPHWPAVR